MYLSTIKHRLICFLIALLLFLPTIWPFHQRYFVFLICFFFLFRASEIRFIKRDGLLMLFVFGFFINSLLGRIVFDAPVPESHLYRAFGFLFFIISALIGRNLNQKTIQFLLYFVVIESIVCVIEYGIGSPTIFSGQGRVVLANKEAMWGESGLMYNSRVFGLSQNSSHAAQKIMIGFMLLHGADMNSKIKALFLPIFLMALFFTFNRTSIIFSAAFLTFWLFSLMNKRKNKLVIRSFLFIIVLLAFSLCFLGYNYINFQFTRKQDLSTVFQGRTEFWFAGVEFIKENLMVGNYSQRFVVTKETYSSHLHNSFLQILCDNGVFLGFILFGYVASLLNRKNLIYFILIALYSFFQPGIFWSISFMDIMLYYFLRPRKRGAMPISYSLGNPLLIAKGTSFALMNHSHFDKS